MSWTILFAIPLFLLPVGYFIWLRVLYSRPPVPGVAVVAEYDPPADVSPIEAAFLLDGTLKPRALAAEILGLTLKGALDVIESGGAVVELRRRQAAVPLADHETIVLASLFGEGNSVTPKEAAGRVEEVAKAIEHAVVAELRRKGFLAERSLSAVILFFSAAMSALMISLALIPAFGFRGALAVLASLVLMAQFAYVAATWRPRLTARGREATLHLMGFKVWFTQVEADNVAWLEKEERRLTAYSPYAVVLGASLGWATKLQKITNALLKNVL